MRALWTGGQIQGAREYQEDFFGIAEGEQVLYLDKEVPIAAGLLPEHQSLLVVVDGMGGMGHGDLAASMIVEAFIESFLANYRCNNNIKQRFTVAISQANKAIAEHISQFPEREGMGATIVAVLWDSIESKIYWLSMGDSLLMRLSQSGQIEALNEKHTWLEQADALREKGYVITEEDLENHGSALCSAVDGSVIDLIDINADGLILSENDIVVLGSDGLETLVKAELTQLLNKARWGFSMENTLESKGDALADCVQQFFNDIDQKENPHQDNTTALVMGICK